ncbi:MAG: RNA methyltransferase [Candidatus Marinimicrobia bacterium]|nr:RNA methyltransferase [Candidatus Neomarinimicrobiota bacterium]
MSTIQTDILTRDILKTAASLQNKKFRSLENRLLIEGTLPLEEALKSEYRVTDIFYSPFLLEKPGLRELIAGAQARWGTRCFETTGSQLKQLSSEVTPQGLVAIAEQKTFDIAEMSGNILVLDRLQDPGNVGTLFRIAHWFGLGGILLIKGTVEAANPKAVRASMGSFFHIPFVYSENIPPALLEDRTLLLSKTRGKTGFRDIGPEKFILVIGNEARGIDPLFDAYPHRDLTLPPLGGAESLNAAVAAAAILSKLLY